MSAKNVSFYLNGSPYLLTFLQLLVSHSVVEVERVAHRLQREVDSKREELRVMVGERYRFIFNSFYERAQETNPTRTLFF